MQPRPESRLNFGDPIKPKDVRKRHTLPVDRRIAPSTVWRITERAKGPRDLK